MGIYATMANDAPDARILLEVSPDQYVTERTRLVKQARADKDKERAAFYQSLKRPSVGLWAVLAAGDSDVVTNILAVTKELGDVQAGGSNPSSLSAATQRRRATLEGFVDRAVNSLAMFDDGAEKRRSEIRSVVDQLSRHPEIAGAWIDATLREMPDEQFGFGAFSDVSVSAPSKPAGAKGSSNATAKKSPRAVPEPPEPTRDLAAERAARAKLAEQKKQAKKDVAEAARDLTAADRKVEIARAAVRAAEKELRAAEERQTAAAREHDRAVEHHDSFH
jgi:hypothetical protein